MYNKWYDQAQVSTVIVHFQNPYTYTINVVMYHHGAIDVGHESSLQLCCDLETRIPVGPSESVVGTSTSTSELNCHVHMHWPDSIKL